MPRALQLRRPSDRLDRDLKALWAAFMAGTPRDLYTTFDRLDGVPKKIPVG
jgi:hypothetical protein